MWERVPNEALEMTTTRKFIQIGRRQPGREEKVQLENSAAASRRRCLSKSRMGIYCFIWAKCDASGGALKILVLRKAENI